MNLLTIAQDATTAMPTVTNPLLDENGNLVSTEEAVSKFSKLWQQWDPLGKLATAIPKLIVAVILVLLGLWLSKLLSKLCVKAMKARGVDASVYEFVRRIINAVVKFFFFLFALSMFFNVNSFLAAFGAIGLTAGLGLQSIVSQFAGGIQILLGRHFKSGDYISVDGNEGSVAEIRFMNTVIITNDNKRVIIPNSHITSSDIVNYSAEGKRRLDLPYGISYDESIEKARKVILGVISKNSGILTDPEPAILVMSHEESCVNLIARIWCKTEDYWNVYFYMQENVKLAFDENSISIPFNQLDVHFDKAENLIDSER